MYRVVSVGSVSGRTLGYIQKTEKFDLDQYLGQVVGVVGQAQIDRSLQLNLITPYRVDRLKAADGAGLAPVGESGSTPAAAPKDPAPAGEAAPADGSRGTPGMGRRPGSPDPEEQPDGGQ